MDTHPSENDLLVALDRCDRLILECASGHLSFTDFLSAYDNFYWSFPLDGHESDRVSESILAKYAARIAPHKAVAESVLAKVCSDADAAQESYRAAGRFGSTEAVARLKLVAEGLQGGEA